MESNENSQLFIDWCHGVAGDVMHLSGQDNLLCRKIDRVEICQAQQAAELSLSLDDAGNLVTEVFYAPANNHQPWCMVSMRNEDDQPLLLVASQCVLTMRLHDGLNELVISPDYGWEDEQTAELPLVAEMLQRLR
ncbi:hypothetical protein [Raoultella sp. T31]|uniref:hypothetical protein n=1 Tax=Raoultella sp. T31 TaxID=2054594 RepID=UPI001054E6AA